MTNTATQAAPTVSRSATRNRVTCTTDDNSVTFRDDAESANDALNRRALQLDALLGMMLAETELEDVRGGVSGLTTHALTWLASDLCREIRLLVEVAK